MKLTGRARIGLPALLLVGLVAGGTYAFWGRAQGAPVVNERALAHTMFFPDIRVRLVPPSAKAAPRLTAVDAHRAYLNDAVPPRLDKESSMPPVVSLAVYTSETGETSGMAPTLVWVVKFMDAPVINLGPKSNGADSSFRCPFYIIIDAISGKRLESFQTCDPPTTG